MAELPSGLLEACVVVGASSEKLRDVYQVLIFSYAHYKPIVLLDKIKVQINYNYVICGWITSLDYVDFVFTICTKHFNYSNIVQLHQQSKLNDLSLLEAEVLQVHAPPFVSKETNSNQSIGPAFSRVQRRRSFIKKVN